MLRPWRQRVPSMTSAPITSRNTNFNTTPYPTCMRIRAPLPEFMTAQKKSTARACKGLNSNLGQKNSNCYHLDSVGTNVYWGG